MPWVVSSETAAFHLWPPSEVTTFVTDGDAEWKQAS